MEANDLGQPFDLWSCGIAPLSPQVTLVVPVHNAERWIAETLRSVLHQSCPPEALELIVVDDGSTDASRDQAIAALASGRIHARVIATQNGGPSRARNIGWRLARAAWVQFLDADDLLHPDKLALQLRTAAPAPAEVALLHSDWQRLAPADGSWRASGSPASPQIGAAALEALLRDDGFIQVGAGLFRRTWLERVGGFDERHWLIEDVDLLMRLVMSGGLLQHAPSPRPLFFYRQHAASLSRRDPQAFIEGCVRNGRLAEEYWRRRGELTPERAQLVATLYLQGARFFATRDRPQFEQLAGSIEALVPAFVPPGPHGLRLLSRAFGYRRAELLAALYRRVKQVAYH